MRTLPLNPALDRLELPCRPWGRPAVLVLVLPTEASSLLAALWRWPCGVSEAPIGRA
jgi:hypothetical protein